ncbi:hypothetical protein [Shewanella sp. 10N.286.48.A6]|nr:hypothetical protein [Shewanella sp. 10N.286.48.A6]
MSKNEIQDQSGYSLPDFSNYGTEEQRFMSAALKTAPIGRKYLSMVELDG